MDLFFVEHTHQPEACPAQDPEQGNYLLEHLSPGSARQHGVKLLADAVLDGKHQFKLIVEAGSEEKVREFMQPFEMAGSLDIHPASHCETVVEREGC